jgi:heavy metal translocating P-type ATPase
MTCTLCGLDSGDQEFCCAGCRNVHAILRESGVLAAGQDFRETAIYKESLRLGLVGRTPWSGCPPGPDPPVRQSQTGAAAAERASDLREAVYQVSGLWCGSCAWLIEHALERTEGVASAEVNFASDLLKVRYNPRLLPPGRIAERVRSLGYSAAAYTGRDSASDRQGRDLLLRAGVALFLWMNAMTFSLIVYAGYFGPVTAFYARSMPFLLMALATPAVVYCAAPVLRLAWAGLRAGVLRMEALLATGILAAYGYSAAQAFRGGHEVYFDTVCAIVALSLVGKAMERGAKDRTMRAITLLYRLMPNKARVMAETGERFVSLEALKPGAVFRVKSGERVPADGVVVEGESHADESVLTGESAPRAKKPGDTVASGSVNVGGVLDIRATRVGAESTLARIVATVEQAAARRTGMERTVDRVSAVFIPAVLALALAAFAGWQWKTGRAEEALLHAIAVLVIACPCALGIATPLALTAAVGAASRRGILVSDARVLETVRGINVMVLDKTGTVTRGEFALTATAGDTSRLAELAAGEAWSEHPLAKSLEKAVPGPRLQACEVRIHAGMGIAGRVGDTGYFLGNRKLLEALGVPAAPDYPLAGTVVLFGWDRQAKGALAFGDRIRGDAPALCAALRGRGIRSMLVSGDTREATSAAAAEIGADEWRAEVSPEEKAELVRSLRTAGKVVAMAGDGVNDAPALAEADLGIALSSGADIAIQAAPLVLMNNSLAAVLETLDLSRRAFRVVRQNLFWAFVYNTLGIALAAAGILNPILAAGAMVISSLTVIANSLRLGTHRTAHGPATPICDKVPPHKISTNFHS